MIVKLTEREFTCVEMLARGRHFLKDTVNPNRKLEHWSNSQYEADVLGMMGEYAVAKYLKIPFDTSINLDGDGGETDMYLGDWKIQVKATKYSSGRLVFNKKDEVKALLNVLTLCNIETKEVNILGYISEKKANSVMYEKDLGHGLRYCIDQKELKPIPFLTYYYIEHIEKPDTIKI